MYDQLFDLIQKSRQRGSVATPIFFKLNNLTDKEHLKELLKTHPFISIYDEILGQVEELVKGRNPKRVFVKKELTEAAIAYLGDRPHEEYGTWVYYPWSDRLVHILDEQEFAEVRTNRNQYKITPEEREILSKKKIGVIGMSVGQSVSLTLAQERTFGELRIADFDILELSNYNRIRTGVHNLGVNKAISVAREIAEIDPYLKVVPFTEGLTEENMDDFFLKDGQLDLLVDECDGLDIKVLARVKARALKIPVVMEASDRGLIDIERYDLEPSRPFFHGLAELDVKTLKSLKTNEEKIPYLLAMIGFEKTSTRLKASMLEVEQTITTWPQLASAVTLGGALSADVCRRIFLKQFNDSGRYYVDLEDLLRDHPKGVEAKQENNHIVQPLTQAEMKECVQQLNQSSDEEQAVLSGDEVKQLVSAAVLAPSGANSQPWKWFYSKNLYLFLDESRSQGQLYFNHLASYAGLGAATENLVLKVHQMGLEVSMDQFPSSRDRRLIATFRFYKKKPSLKATEPHPSDSLVHVIDKRLTNRLRGDQSLLNPEILKGMQDLVSQVKGAELHLIEEAGRLKEIGELIGKVDKVRIMNQQSHKEFVSELRWSKEESHATKDGIDIASLDLTTTELIGFNLARDWSIIQYLNEWKGGSVFEKLSKRAVISSSAIGLLTVPSNQKEDFFLGGRALQRLWLYATENNIDLQPHTASIYLFTRLINGNGEGLNEKMSKELKVLRKEFLNLFQLTSGKGEVFLFRLFKGDTPNVKSLRIPLEEVLTIQ